jgi:hypothetical protein
MKKCLLFSLIFIFTVGIANYGSAQLFKQIGQELSNAGNVATSNIAKDVKKSLGLPYLPKARQGQNSTTATPSTQMPIREGAWNGRNNPGVERQS